MNLKVRIKNPIFWVQVALAILAPIAAYFGISYEHLSSWPALGEMLLGAIKNPYVLALVAVSVWNALNDPTTKGVADSEVALSHDTPADTILTNKAA